MDKITSAQNPTVKHLRKLATDNSFRNARGQTILEGTHLCQSYLQANLKPSLLVFTAEALGNKEVQSIIQLTPETPTVEVPASLFNTFSSVKNSVGVLFVADIPPKSATKLSASALLLDAVQDPGNLGAMLRTAAAAGMKQVFTSAGSASAWSPKALRAGMGAHFALDIYENTDLAALINGAEVPVFATSLQANKSIYNVDLAKPTAWIFGSEGSGVSAKLLKLCKDSLVIIPQHSGVESLNVAAAAAVCLFEHRRQLLDKTASI